MINQLLENLQTICPKKRRKRKPINVSGTVTNAFICKMEITKNQITTVLMSDITAGHGQNFTSQSLLSIKTTHSNKTHFSSVRRPISFSVLVLSRSKIISQSLKSHVPIANLSFSNIFKIRSWYFWS